MTRSAFSEFATSVEQSVIEETSTGRSRDGDRIRLVPENRALPLPPALALDVQPTTLLGRSDELEEIAQTVLQGKVRLLTLVGPAGVGKTRLAVEVASQLSKSFDAGGIVIDLAPIHDPAQVLPAIARSVGMADHGVGSLLERLGEYIDNRHLLLVLDNFEQVMAAGHDMCRLLARCPSLKILVTSRVPLELRWEHVYRVPPLAVPGRRAPGTLDALLAFPSVALFIERAQARCPSFRATEDQAAIIAQLVTHLDGLPLAIELAAARLNVLPLEVIAEQIQERLQLLQWHAQDLPRRHQSLEAAIEWSYELLTESEQWLFRCLGVFSGYVSPEAAAAVAGVADRHDVLERLASLAEKSLVLPATERVRTSSGVHFRLLETVRQYAEDRLRLAGELECAQRAHAEKFLQLAVDAAPDLRTPGQSAWFLRLEREHDNLRRALRWLLDRSDHAAALRLASALSHFWIARGYHVEGRRWLEEALSHAPDADPGIRMRALLGLAVILMHSDLDRSRAVVEEALDLAQQRQNHYGIAESLTLRGWQEAYAARWTESTEYLQRALSLWEELDDRSLMAFTLFMLGIVTYRRGHAEKAAALHLEALDQDRGIGYGTSQIAFCLALILQELGDVSRAVQLVLEGLQMTIALQDCYHLSIAADATLLLVDDRTGQEEQAQLLGARDSLRQVTGSSGTILEELLGRSLNPVRKLLDHKELAILYRRGYSLSFDEVASLMQGILEAFSQALKCEGTTEVQREGVLSERELEVLRLVAQGLSSKTIAQRLLISRKTVDHHVSSTLRKLGVDSRAQAVARAAQQGLL